jgi:hypothetical protein
MKKVVLACLLTCAAIASGLPSAFAQTPVSLGTQAAAAAPCPPMPDAEYKPYTDAMAQTTPQGKATGIEAYLTAFPQSCYKTDMLVTLMALYSQLNDPAKLLGAADSILKVAPADPRALYAEALVRRSTADALPDAAAKQAGLDAAADFAQRAIAALAGPKPASMADADFKTLQTSGPPSCYSTIAYAAYNKKDFPTAIANYKKELASVPVAQTQAPGPILQDTFYLASAYEQTTPPDWLSCTFYATRFTDFAPEPYKSQIAPTAKFCYRKYHGKEDGYDYVVTAAQTNLNPPADFATKITPAPTPADIVADIIKTTPDLSTLATSDKEYILQNGKPEDAAKVWDTVKGKSYQFPDVVIVAATPTQLQVSLSDDAIQSKTADFTFNLAAPEEIPEPKPTATVAQKAAYKKALADAKKKADAVAGLTVVGAKVTLIGTYDSYTPNPIMIIMKDGDVVLPKAAKPAAPVHHAPAHK